MNGFGGFNPQDERHRPVVDERDLHVGPELTRCDSGVKLTNRFDQAVEQPASGFRVGGGREAGPQTLAGVGGQSELGHQQNATVDIADAQVHLAPGVAEYTVGQQTFREAARLIRRIALLDRDQRQQTPADAAHGGSIDADFGFRDALDDGDHTQ